MIWAVAGFVSTGPADWKFQHRRRFHARIFSERFQKHWQNSLVGLQALSPISSLQYGKMCGIFLCKYVGMNGCSIFDGKGGAARELKTATGTSALIAHIEGCHENEKGGEFTWVTGWASYEATIAGDSTIKSYVRNERHFGCQAHQASTIWNDACDPELLINIPDRDLQRVGADLNSMFKVLTKIAKAEIEYTLETKPIKRAKTRFLYLCPAAKRFLETTANLYMIAIEKRCEGALAALRELKLFSSDGRGDAALEKGISDKYPTLASVVITLSRVREFYVWAQS